MVTKARMMIVLLALAASGNVGCDIREVDHLAGTGFVKIEAEGYEGWKVEEGEKYLGIVNMPEVGLAFFGHLLN